MTYLFFVYAVDIQTDIHINVLFLNLFYVKITLFNKDKMLEKVLKIKDFYPLLRCSNTTHSTWLELMALMSYYFARLWKHISSIFGTIGRREHIHQSYRSSISKQLSFAYIHHSKHPLSQVYLVILTPA